MKSALLFIISLFIATPCQATNVVFEGDSITDSHPGPYPLYEPEGGYVDLLQELRLDFVIRNDAVAGSSTIGVLNRVKQWPRDKQRNSIFVVMAGINDPYWIPGGTAEETAKRLFRIARLATRRGYRSFIQTLTPAPSLNNLEQWRLNVNAEIHRFGGRSIGKHVTILKTGTIYSYNEWVTLQVDIHPLSLITRTAMAEYLAVMLPQSCL